MFVKVFESKVYNNNDATVPRGTIHPAAKASGFSLPLDPTNYKRITI